MSEARATVTPTYLLDGATGWRASSATVDVLQDPLTQVLRIGKPGEFSIAPHEPFGTFGGRTLPRGVAISEAGHLLIADPGQNRILHYSSLRAQQALMRDKDIHTDNASTNNASTNNDWPLLPLWQQLPAADDSADEHLQHEVFRSSEASDEPDAYRLKEPHDVAFSPFGEIVIADTGHQRVLIFSWPELRLRRQIDFAGDPTALAYDSQQRLYVADARRGRIYRYSSLWALDPEYVGGASALQTPVAIAMDAKDNLWVLDSQLQEVRICNPAGDILPLDINSQDVLQRSFAIPPLVLENNELYHPQLSRPNCERWHLAGIQVDTLGYVKGTSLALLARARGLRLPRTGEYISQPLDIEIAAGQWHRLTLDVDIPSAGRIVLQTHTSDRSVDDSELAAVNWSEPALFTQADQDNATELLVQSGRGRYLRIRMRLFGDGFTTPIVQRMHVFGPRNSALQYLPPPYRQDPDSEYFLDRWLSYFDVVFDEVRFQIQDFTHYLDPQTVPVGPYLEWLGSWFDWKFLAQWSESVRREMIARSIEFYKLRGTLEGLRVMLQWHTGLSGVQPGIIEHYRVRDYQDRQNLAGSATQQALFIGGKPFTPPADQINHWFSVVLPASVAPDQVAIDTLHAIIAAQKPAHTAFRLCLFSPGVRIGQQSSIGVDSWLGHYPDATLGEFTLGQAGQLSGLTSPGVVVGRSMIQNHAAKGGAHGYS